MATTTPAALAKHIDFTGYQVTLADAPGLTLPVKVAVYDAECEICGDAALYTTDASELGDAGYSPSFCQQHMDDQVFVYGPEAGDVWTVKA